MHTVVQKLTDKDDILRSIVNLYGFPIVQKREPGFSALCHIILEQQVSIASANACFEKIQWHLDEITPLTISKVSIEELQRCGVSRQKISYLKNLASKVLENEINIESLATKPELAVRSELRSLKGVGNWTIDVYLMFCLKHPDIMPLGDIAIKNTIKELYNLHTIEAMEDLTALWKPYRTMASFILWHYYLKKRNKI